MEMRAIEEASSPSRIEGGPGEARASTRAASGARRAPAAVDEARPIQTRDGPAGAAHGHVVGRGGPGSPGEGRGRRGKHIGLEKPSDL